MSDTPIPTKPPRRWKRIVLAMVIFMAGICVGAAGATGVIVHRIRIAIQHPEEARTRIESHLRRKLSLRPEQVERIDRILKMRQARLQNIRTEVLPRVDAELDAMRTEVAGSLEPAQREKWEKLFDDVRENWLPPRVASTKPLNSNP